MAGKPPKSLHRKGVVLARAVKDVRDRMATLRRHYEEEQARIEGMSASERRDHAFYLRNINENMRGLVKELGATLATPLPKASVKTSAGYRHPRKVPNVVARAYRQKAVAKTGLAGVKRR